MTEGDRAESLQQPRWARFAAPHWGTRSLLVASIGLVALSAIIDLTPITGVGALVMFTGFLFVLVHGSATLGWRNLIAFVVITIAISFAAESIGVATGIVFGHYHYSGELGPKLLGVPLVIQVAYMAMGYASLMTARAILGIGTANGRRPFAVALAGTIAMVSWDMAIDPSMSTVGGDWIWEVPGGQYFGVGVHNFAGWFCTVFLFMFLYELWERRNPAPPPRGVPATRLFRAEPVLYYAVIALGIVATPLIKATPDKLATPMNWSGSIADLNASLALVACFAMGGPVVFALLRICDRDEDGAGARETLKPRSP